MSGGLDEYGRPAAGPRVRTDIVDVYVIRARGGRDASASTMEVLQLRRVEAPLAGTWQPVMGHVEPGERAVQAAAREAGQELGLNLGDESQCVDLFALEQVHPFFIAELDAVFLSPRLVAVVAPGWEPALNQEHDAHRWVALDPAGAAFMWPGQRAALAELAGLLEGDNGATLAALRIDRDMLA